MLEAHGAVVHNPTDRHARKRAVLADAESALRGIHEAKDGAVVEAQAAAARADECLSAEVARAARLRLQEAQFVDLAAGYLQLAEEAAMATAAQDAAVAAARANLDRLAALAHAANKPFRKLEVPLERTIESLRKRLARGGAGK